MSVFNKELKNKQRTQQVLAMIYAAFPHMTNRPKDDVIATGQTYAIILDDINPDLVEAAVIQILSEDREFPPKPGEIRQAAIALQNKATNAPQLPDGVTAWTMAQAYASEIVRRRNYSHGYNQIVDGQVVEIPFPDFHPAVIEAAKAVGIDRIFNADVTDAMEIGTLSAQFRDTYATVKTRAEKAAEVTHPLISTTIAQVAARLRAPMNGAVVAIEGAK